jgi:5-methylcytosine-specific restriction endonuclease McrA
MTKKYRQLVFDKYKGKCAYCGCDLQKGWHVDHIQAIRRNDSDESIERMNKIRTTPLVRGQNSIENYNPACRQCNIWKSTYNIEQFRKEVAEQIKRLNDYNPNYRNAKRYGLIFETNIEVKFHFETVLAMTVN